MTKKSELTEAIDLLRRSTASGFSPIFMKALGVVIDQAERAQDLEESCNVSNCLDKFTNMTGIENKRLKKALFVSLSHAVESQSDGTVDVITDTLQDLDFTDIWDEDYEKGKRLWEEWRK